MFLSQTTFNVTSVIYINVKCIRVGSYITRLPKVFHDETNYTQATKSVTRRAVINASLYLDSLLFTINNVVTLIKYPRFKKGEIIKMLLQQTLTKLKKLIDIQQKHKHL